MQKVHREKSTEGETKEFGPRESLKTNTNKHQTGTCFNMQQNCFEGLFLDFRHLLFPIRHGKIVEGKFDTDFLWRSHDLVQALAGRHTHSKVKAMADKMVEHWEAQYPHAFEFRASDAGAQPTPAGAAQERAPPPATPVAYEPCRGFECACEDRAEMYVPGEGHFCRSCHFNFCQANL